MIIGRLQKFYKENCLVDQEFIKDSDKTISQVMNEYGKQIGEKLISAATLGMNWAKVSKTQWWLRCRSNGSS